MTVGRVTDNFRNALIGCGQVAYIYRVVSHKEYFSLVHWIDNSTNDILLDDLPYPHGRGLIRYNVGKLTSNDHTNEAKLPALQARFREHTHHIFERLGMKVVAYWIPTTAPAANNTLIYIIEHESEADAKQKWQTFINDPTWKAAYQASIKDGALVDSIDVVFMQETDFSSEL